MLMSSGNAKSLDAVMSKFLDFAQTSSYNTQAWKLVDDRLSSFYGATLQVPVKKKVAGLITGGISTDALTTLGFYYTTSGAIVGSAYESPLRPCAHQYFTPTVENNSYISASGLNRVVKYLDEMPDVIKSMPNNGACFIQLFEGYTPTSPELFSFGLDSDKIYSAWVDLLETNKASNADNDVILILSGGKKLADFSTDTDYINAFTNVKYSALDKRIFNLFHRYGYCVMDFSSIVLAKYKKLIDFLGLTTTTANGIYFNEDFSNFITSEVTNLIRDYQNNSYDKCQYFYMSFQHTVVDNSTYSNWLRTDVSDTNILEGRFTANHSSYFDTVDVGYFRGSNTYDHTENNGKNYQYQNSTKYGNGANKENLFKNTGEFVAVGLHTHFDYDLWLCEQGGITCDAEMSTVDYNISKTNMLGLIPISRYRVYRLGGKGNINANAPLFPGTGCPWFCVSTQDMEDYDVELRGIDYWFTKEDYNATITIRLRNPNYLPDVYQTMSFGLLDGITAYNHKFPMYVCGGSQGISHDIWIHTLPGQKKPSYVVGNIYDLSICNPTGGGNNALYPTKFNGSSVSNFKVMTPEGMWEDLFGSQQVATVVTYGSCSPSSVHMWGYPLQTATALSGVQHSSAIPFSNYPYDSVVDTYAVNQFVKDLKFSGVYNNFIISLSSSSGTHDNGCQGFISNMGYSFSRNLSSGEVTIDNKRFLCIPNGWDSKLKFYRWHLGKIYNDEWDIYQLKDEFNSLINPLRNNMYNGKILIPLEDI